MLPALTLVSIVGSRDCGQAVWTTVRGRPGLVLAMNAWAGDRRRSREPELQYAHENVGHGTRLAPAMRGAQHESDCVVVKQDGGSAAGDRSLSRSDGIWLSGSRIKHAHAVVVHEAQARRYHAGAEADGVSHAHRGTLVVVGRD